MPFDCRESPRQRHGLEIPRGRDGDEFGSAENEATENFKKDSEEDKVMESICFDDLEDD